MAGLSSCSPLRTRFAAISGTALSIPLLALAQVQPVPIAGGDVLGPPAFPPLLIHQFLPGPGAGFDGLNAEMNGITDFRGLAALAYTSGTATEQSGRNYIAQTDIRLYRGDYVAADGETD